MNAPDQTRSRSQVNTSGKSVLSFRRHCCWTVPAESAKIHIHGRVNEPRYARRSLIYFWEKRRGTKLFHVPKTNGRFGEKWNATFTIERSSFPWNYECAASARISVKWYYICGTRRVKNGEKSRGLEKNMWRNCNRNV